MQFHLVVHMTAMEVHFVYNNKLHTILVDECPLFVTFKVIQEKIDVVIQQPAPFDLVLSVWDRYKLEVVFRKHAQLILPDITKEQYDLFDEESDKLFEAYNDILQNDKFDANKCTTFVSNCNQFIEQVLNQKPYIHILRYIVYLAFKQSQVPELKTDTCGHIYDACKTVLNNCDFDDMTKWQKKMIKDIRYTMKVLRYRDTGKLQQKLEKRLDAKIQRMKNLSDLLEGRISPDEFKTRI